jgi:acetyl esterase
VPNRSPNRSKLGTSLELRDTPSVDAVRAAERAQRTKIPRDCTVADRSVASARGELRLRCYQPSRPKSGKLGEGEGAGLVFFHASGFVAGDPASHDAFCGQLSVASGCTVVACSYRLAPEHRFPTALDDAYFATCFVHEHADEFGIDHRRLGISGIEVGSSLATGVARLAKDRRNPALGFQLLVNPVLDFAPAALSGAASLSVGAASLEWAVAQYIDATLREDPRCSPLRANNLIGLPAALIVCAGEDTMTDQAERYAARLRTAHVPVTVACNPGAAVDFLEVPDSSESGRSALGACSRALFEALGR